MKACLTLTLLLVTSAVTGDPPTASDVDIAERLDSRVPSDLGFVDSNGTRVALGDLLGARPVILSFVYFRCKVLCNLMLSGLVTSLRALDWKPGREFDLITVSLDPDETPALAARAREGRLQSLGQTQPPPRWAFLTGSTRSIDALADAVGFKYRLVDGAREFAHVSGLVVLTPDGRVSRYLYGVEFPPTQLKAALFEAAGGRVGTSFERVLLRCWKYDPASRRYQLFLTRYFRIGGLVLLGATGIWLARLWRRDLAQGRT